MVARRMAPGAILASLLGVWLVVWLSSCPQPQSPLRLATTPWIGYQPLVLAEDLGQFPHDAIRLVEFSSNTESLRALRNRDVEAAALTLDEALLLSAEGHDTAVILMLDCSSGADALVARPEIGSLSDLIGRRVGVESSANGAYVLKRALQLAGLAPADIEIVPLPAGDQVATYRAGLVDALVTYEPLRTQLAALGAVTLFDSREIPYEIVDVLAVRREVIRERDAQVERLLRGWFAAVDHLASARDEAAARLAPRLGLRPADYLAAAAGVEFGTLAMNCRAFDPPIGAMGLVGRAREVAHFMKENGLIPADPSLDRLVEPGPATDLGCQPLPETR
jgi:NitT/TauT family transport system substrate-binding protein